jgi:hypothetical protein
MLLLSACRNILEVPIDQVNLPANFPVGSSEREFDEYQFAVDQLLAAIPRSSSATVEVWTDKEVYEIGDTMTFFYRSNRDVYLTLIDVGTSGRMHVIFPNEFLSDNLVAGNRTYTVPHEDAGFSIYVTGPPGVERIKVIATERPVSLFGEGVERGVHIFPQFDGRRAQDIELITRKLLNETWAHAYTEVEVVPNGTRESGSARPREIKPKPPEKPIDIIGVPGAKFENPSDRETGISVGPLPKGKPASEMDRQGNVVP